MTLTDEQEDLIRSADTPERRVQCVRALISESAWAPSLAWELEKKWKVTTGELAVIYTDAIHSIDEMFLDMDIETKRAILASQLQHLAKMALAKKKAVFSADGETQVFADPDIRGANEAYKTYATIAGVTSGGENERDPLAKLIERASKILGDKSPPLLETKKPEKEEPHE